MTETKTRKSPRPQESPERYDDNDIEQPLLAITDNSENEDLPNHAQQLAAKSHPSLPKSNLDSSIDVSPSQNLTISQTLNLAQNMGSKPNKNPIKKRSMNNLNQTTGTMVSKNTINNRKYNVWTFLPMLIFNQFKFFFNFYFLVITCSQFFDIFNLGYLFVYAAPLTLVLLITFMREAYDEIKRFSRDNSFNKKKYLVMVGGKLVETESQGLKPGDIIYLAAGSGTPAD
jgi:magnesium-transporting ATPase (P-type)